MGPGSLTHYIGFLFFHRRYIVLKSIRLVTLTILAVASLLASTLAQVAPGNGVTDNNPLQIAILHWYAANLTTPFPVAAGSSLPFGIAFDGANMWVTNIGSNDVTK